MCSRAFCCAPAVKYGFAQPPWAVSPNPPGSWMTPSKVTRVDTLNLRICDPPSRAVRHRRTADPVRPEKESAVRRPRPGHRVRFPGRPAGLLADVRVLRDCARVAAG